MDKVLYEYSVLRYVPDVERGEYVNVGILMLCKRLRWVECLLHVDKERIESFSDKADVSLLLQQLRAFDGADVPESSLPAEERYRWMAAVKSAIIQCSPSHPGILPVPECANASERKEALLRECVRLAERLC